MRKILNSYLIIAAYIFLSSINSFASEFREQIRIVGSSTLYPFITIAAERFGKISGRTPVVEATGTGGGFHLLCSGNSMHYPDIVNASRAIKPSETELCKKNGVNNLAEILVGYDGIILAQTAEAQVMQLSQEELFLALAKKIPQGNSLVDNYYKKWQEINPKLPDSKIEIYGPSYISGTRDAFIELVMQDFCKKSAQMNKIITKQKELMNICSEIREDGYYIEMPENDNLIIHKLSNNHHALGLISFSILSENPQIKSIMINNIIPTKESIIAKEYPFSRPLFIYVNNNHIKYLSSIGDFVAELKSLRAIGPNGYLTQKGLLNY